MCLTYVRVSLSKNTQNLFDNKYVTVQTSEDVGLTVFGKVHSIFTMFSGVF